VEFVGIDWATRRAAWCAVDAAGRRLGEGAVPADEGGLLRLVAERGLEVTAAVEMMSGAAWIAETLRGVGWTVRVADARRARALAPLAAKTDRIDARVLAELARRELVPEVWVPSLADRALLEQLLRRMHLIRLRTSAKNRIFGLLSQWGVRAGVTHLRQPGAVDALAERGVPEVWRASISEAIAVIDVLDARIAPIDTELTRLARADERAVLLRTIPGVGWLLGLTFAAEIGNIARFPSAGKLVGYSGLVPRVRQSGESSRIGRLAKAGSPLLRWAAVEAAQHAWRPQNPWHRLYVDVRKRHGHGNAAKSAVAQGPDRGLARLVAPAALHARRLVRGPDRPGKLRPAPGRLTARLRIEKPGQLPPDTMRRPSAERELSPTSASREPPELPLAC
jgi:transposase